jgi:hypothetical protein
VDSKEGVILDKRLFFLAIFKIGLLRGFMWFAERLCIALFFVGYFFCLNNFCFAGDKVNYVNINDVPPEAWRNLSQKKIYFGHQSVGFNMIDGIKELMRQYPGITLNFVETDDLARGGGIFAHSRIGKNRDPEGKLYDFVKIISQNSKSLPDVAILKFCYVDMHDRIDVSNLFAKYREAAEGLRKAYPKILLVHFTMPLRVQDVSWKARLKTALGREPGELKDAVKRNQFNSILLKEYEGREPVFDLARFEATAPDASVSSFQFKGGNFLAMQPQYTYDGGHLNQRGKMMIAERFLLFLVNNTL